MTKPKANIFHAGRVIEIGLKIIEEFKKEYPIEYKEIMNEIENETLR